MSIYSYIGFVDVVILTNQRDYHHDHSNIENKTVLLISLLPIIWICKQKGGYDQ